MKVEAILFDVDGVLSLHQQPFSKAYAQRHHADYSPFRDFFQGDFQKALIGQADLMQLITAAPELWGNSNPDTLLQEWFSFEEELNQPILEVVQALRAQGLRCYVATNQERYRGRYIRETMLVNQFDDYFISAFVKAKKPEKAFFEFAINSILQDIPDITPEKTLFIDDSPEHIDGAQQLGINTQLHEDTEATRRLLATLLY